MSRDRHYPDEPAGPFESPPVSFTDAAGRDITIRQFGTGSESRSAERDAVFSMYHDFDPVDRAQSLPPVAPDTIVEWLDDILVDTTINVLAWHEAEVAGHAMLVPDSADAYELAIFVNQSYQQAGIGSRLIRCLLGAGADKGVNRVWLTVERWNTAAIKLYRSVGFETTNAASFELEMGLLLE